MIKVPGHKKRWNLALISCIPVFILTLYLIMGLSPLGERALLMATYRAICTNDSYFNGKGCEVLYALDQPEYISFDYMLEDNATLKAPGIELTELRQGSSVREWESWYKKTIDGRITIVTYTSTDSTFALIITDMFAETTTAYMGIVLSKFESY